MEGYVRANHVAQGVILLEDLDGGGIGDLSILHDLNSIHREDGYQRSDVASRRRREMAKGV